MMIEPPLLGFDHRGDGRADGAPRARQVHVDHGVPLFVGQLPEPPPAQHARVRDEDVQPRELLDAVGHHLTQRGAVADIDLTRQDLPACGLDATDRLAQVLGGRQRVGDRRRHRPADVDRDDVGAVVGKPYRVRSALAPGGAGDECDASLK